MKIAHQILLSLIVALILGEAQPLLARKYPRSRNEAWQLIINHQTRVNAAVDIPKMAEFYTWKISGKIGEAVMYPEAVPVYAWNSINNDISSAGTIAVDSEIEITSFVTSRGKLFYKVADELVTLLPEVNLKDVAGNLFVSGYFIYRDDENSFKPPKSFRLEDLNKMDIRAEAIQANDSKGTDATNGGSKPQATATKKSASKKPKPSKSAPR